MDLEQLHALLAIAETGSTPRAAAILHIVQPAISREFAAKGRWPDAVLLDSGTAA